MIFLFACAIGNMYTAQAFAHSEDEVFGMTDVVHVDSRIYISRQQVHDLPGFLHGTA
ncbi:hypothetical protein D3C87_1661900 [compost metagenome]